MTLTANTVYDDYVTSGVPGSGVKDPDKAEIRELLTGYETSLADLRANGVGGAWSKAAALVSVFGTGSGDILVTAQGQSGMLGNDQAVGGDQTTNPNVYAWDYVAGAWKVADLANPPFRGNAGSGVVNNLAFQFCKWLQAETGRVVRLVMYAKADKPWESLLTSASWTSGSNGAGTGQGGGSDDLWSPFTDAMTAAIAAAPSLADTKAAVMLLNIGQNNAEDPVDELQEKVLAYVNQVRAQSWCAATTQFVLSEVGDIGYHGANEAYKRLVRSGRDLYIRLASSRGVPLLADGTHHTAAGLIEQGTVRYPNALLSGPAAFMGRDLTEYPVHVVIENYLTYTTASDPDVIDSGISGQVIFFAGDNDAFIRVDPTDWPNQGWFRVVNQSATGLVSIEPGAPTSGGYGGTYAYTIQDPNDLAANSAAAPILINPGEVADFMRYGDSATYGWRVAGKASNLKGIGNGTLAKPAVTFKNARYSGFVSTNIDEMAWVKADPTHPGVVKGWPQWGWDDDGRFWLGWDTYINANNTEQNLIIGNRIPETRPGITIASHGQSNTNTGSIFFQKSGIVRKAITGITLGNPTLLTIVGHGFTSGLDTSFWSIVGTTELNDQRHAATVVDADTISIAFDSTGLTPYVSGGFATQSTPGGVTAVAAGQQVGAFGWVGADGSSAKVKGILIDPVVESVASGDLRMSLEFSVGQADAWVKVMRMRGSNRQVDINGGNFSRGAPVVKTADFTVADTENNLINNKSGSSCTVTLPAAATYPGREIYFQNHQAQTLVSASSNVIPLGGGAAGTAILAATAGKWAKLVSDGSSAWYIMEAA